MRIVFMGTPEFALPSLRALINMPDTEVVGVFTQPDRPVGRGHKLEKPPVKQLAEQAGIPVFQFEKVRRQQGLDTMRSLRPDLVVTAAFGQILSQKLLDVPRIGTVNVHASLLPKHRGAAPINWSIIMGDTYTGVTTMLTDAGLDTGSMLLQKSVEIGKEETAGELTQRLAEIGAELLRETIEKLKDGSITPVPQDESLMSYEPMLGKTLGLIDWNSDAETISRLVRGVNPWPGAYTFYMGETMKIWRVRPFECTQNGQQNGTVIVSSGKEGLIVKCQDGAVEITEMQMPGGKRMSAKSFLAGKKIPVGTILGEAHE